MKLISVTLTDDKTKDIIGAALRSVVDIVDACLVIQTSSAENHSLFLEMQEAVGDKLVITHWPWEDDFARARNTALKLAWEHAKQYYPGETCYALMLDTDERIEPNGENIRDVIEEASLFFELRVVSAEVFFMTELGGRYKKERIFSLPATGHFVGATHEAYMARSNISHTFETARFSELKKTQEQLDAKWRRDASILQRQILEEPKNPRWHFYLAETLNGLKYYESAVQRYHECAKLKGWPEEGAWACFRAAEILVSQEKLGEALESCFLGISIHPGMAELYWLAGFLCYKLKRFEHACHLARTAILHGRYAGYTREYKRRGFSYQPALYEAPYDTLRFAEKELGNVAEAASAETHFQTAKAMRMGKVVS